MWLLKDSTFSEKICQINNRRMWGIHSKSTQFYQRYSGVEIEKAAVKKVEHRSSNLWIYTWQNIRHLFMLTSKLWVISWVFRRIVILGMYCNKLTDILTWQDLSELGLHWLFVSYGYICHNATRCSKGPWSQGWWGILGSHLGPTGPRWAPCWPHELCYLGMSAMWLISAIEPRWGSLHLVSSRQEVLNTQGSSQGPSVPGYM